MFCRCFFWINPERGTRAVLGNRLQQDRESHSEEICPNQRVRALFPGYMSFFLFNFVHVIILLFSFPLNRNYHFRNVVMLTFYVHKREHTHFPGQVYHCRIWSLKLWRLLCILSVSEQTLYPPPYFTLLEIRISYWMYLLDSVRGRVSKQTVRQINK